jgi:hypothetical protein
MKNFYTICGLLGLLLAMRIYSGEMYEQQHYPRAGTEELIDDENMYYDNPALVEGMSEYPNTDLMSEQEFPATEATMSEGSSCNGACAMMSPDPAYEKMPTEAEMAAEMDAYFDTLSPEEQEEFLKMLEGTVNPPYRAEGEEINELAVPEETDEELE